MGKKKKKRNFSSKHLWSQELLIFLFIFLYLGSQVWRFLTLVSFFHKHFLLCISWIIIYNSRSYGQKGKEIKIQKIKKENCWISLLQKGIIMKGNEESHASTHNKLGREKERRAVSPK